MLKLLKNTAKLILTPFLLMTVWSLFVICLLLNVPLILIGLIVEASGLWNGLPFWMIWTEAAFNVLDSVITKWKQL